MDILKKNLPLISCIVITCLLYFYIQNTLKYYFYYRGQSQIFVYNYDYWIVALKSPGGFSLMCAQFLVQFFSVSCIGALTTSFLVGIGAWLSWLVMKKITSVKYIFPICFLPLLFQLIILIDINYQYQGFISFLFVTIFLWVYTLIFRRNIICRTSLGLFLTVTLFFVAGSVALVFSICIFLYDILTKTTKAYMTFFSLVAIILLGIYGIHNSLISEYRFAFTPDFYYEPSFKTTNFHYFAWLSLPFVVFLSFISQYTKKANNFIKGLLLLMLISILSYFYLYTSQSCIRPSQEELLKLDHFTEMEQWDDVISVCNQYGVNNYMTSNYLNLAFVKKGILLDHLFDYPQHGPKSLIMDNDRSQSGTKLLSQIYFTMGNIAAAQWMAFNSNEIIQKSYSPSMLKVLVQTNIIFGDYAVADKYISILENTWNYRKWAKNIRKYLYNDNAIEKDSILGVKRKDLPRKDGFIIQRGIITDLMDIIDKNPYDYNAIEYTIASLLLAKYKEGIQSFVSKYYRTNVLKTLPTPLKEAIIAFSNGNRKYCYRYGIKDYMLSNYRDFRQKTLLAESQGTSSFFSVKNEYSHSYWVYLMQ
jgi:hypothetical protein